jgi:hypothetical protein
VANFLIYVNKQQNTPKIINYQLSILDFSLYLCTYNREIALFSYRF